MPYKDPQRRKEEGAKRAAAYKKRHPDRVRAQKRRNRARNKGAINAYKRGYRLAHPEQDAAMQRRKYERYADKIKANRRLRDTGWTPEQREAALIAQDGRCWICGIEMVRDSRKYNGIACDHNHDTGRRRGLLCIHCNLLEGVHRKCRISPLEWALRERAYKKLFDEREPDDLADEDERRQLSLKAVR